MSDDRNKPNRQFITLLGGVVMITVIYYVIGWYVELDKNNFLPFILQEGRWIYGGIVVPVVCVVLSIVEATVTRLRMGWTGWFLVGCLILSFAAVNWAIYTLGGIFYA